MNKTLGRLLTAEETAAEYRANKRAALIAFRKELRLFEQNPSAANFLLMQEAAIRYQDVVKNP